MISKVIIGKTFYGACRYVCSDQKRSVVLSAEGVRDYDYKFMAEDFEMQRSARSSLRNAVFHGILSFYPGEKIGDQKMDAIAREYLNEMKIINTQFAIVKHIDKNHTHLHVIANLVNNNGETIKDNWIGLKGKKVAQKLTIKYGLKEAISKNVALTNMEALNEKEVNRYIIYQAILETLPQCGNLNDLKEKLGKKKIETLYKYKGQSYELQGISFKIGDFKYKGSEIDRKFSIRNLEKAIQQLQLNSRVKNSWILSDSKKISENRQLEIHKHLDKNLNILNELIKPQEFKQSVAAEWNSEKRKKKKSKGLHL